MTLTRCSLLSLERRRMAAFGAAFAVLFASAAAAAQTAPPAWTAPPGAVPPPVAAPPATAPPPAAFPPNLQAGGLTPPSSTMPTGPAADPNQTQQDLEKAKKEDSKRGLEWFWINAEGGLSYVDMRTFVANDKDFTAGVIKTQALGGTVGVGLGVRLLFLTLGARGRVGLFDPWDLFTVGGELGVHIPLGRVEPHFELGGGYAALGNVGGLAKGSTDAISISGGYGRISAGLDVFITPLFSIGLLGAADLLALARPGFTPAQLQSLQSNPSVSDAQKTVLAAQGSSLGLAGGVTGVLGLHF